MSAFVVSHHHINLLVSAAIEQTVSFDLTVPGILEPVTEANAQAVGRMLWTENVRSVVFRYNLGGSEEEQAYRAALAGYAFRFYPGIRTAAAAQSLACYDYQSCECPDYEETFAAAFVQRMQAALGDQPKRDAEPWGFDSEALVKAAQGDVL